MTCKHCTKCNELKPLNEFNKHPSGYNGIGSRCKKCTASIDLAYSRTKKGAVKKIYFNQYHHSTTRGHEKPDYTLDELREWAFSQPIFHEIYDDFVSSGYKCRMRVSFDRRDDYKPYTLDNLTIMTWDENRRKGNDDRMNGVNNKQSKSVMQFSKSGELIAEYYSMAKASIETGVSRSKISMCSNGKRKTAGGFIWSLI